MTPHSSCPNHNLLPRLTQRRFTISPISILFGSNLLLLLTSWQLTPNSWLFLTEFCMVLTHFKVPPIASPFHYLFQLKMAKLGVCYFIIWQEVQFLTRCFCSHKGWKESFFFVRPPLFWTFLLNGSILARPPLATIKRGRIIKVLCGSWVAKCLIWAT